MIVYIIKVFSNNYGDDESENGNSWQELGAYASLNKALEKAKSYLEEDMAFYKARNYDVVGAAEEITTALKVVPNYAIKYVNGSDWDKTIEIERLKVEE